MNRTIKLLALIALCCGVALLTGCSKEKEELSYEELSGNYFAGTWTSSWSIEVFVEVEVVVDGEEGETKTEIISKQIKYFSSHTFKANKTWQSTFMVDEEAETFNGTYNFSEKNKTLTLIALTPENEESKTKTTICKYVFDNNNTLRITDDIADIYFIKSRVYTKQ